MTALPQPQSSITPQDYLARERQADYKSEYFDGEIFAMAGASERHNLIAGNIFAELHVQLRQRPCKVYMNDMRLNINPTGLYTYPDVMVVCGEGRYADTHQDTLLNPILIVEVLSPSTEAYDRGEKFAHYRCLESLQEFLLLAQEKSQVEYYRRQTNDEWLLSELDTLDDRLELLTLDCQITLADIYAKVEFK